MTPAELIAAIVTEQGVHRAPYAESLPRHGARVKALVLAAGYATRLYPLTLDRPKALLEVGGRPMLDRMLERLEAMGVDETIVVTNAKFTPHFEEWAKDKRARPRRERRDDLERRPARARSATSGSCSTSSALDDDLVVVAGDNLFGERHLRVRRLRAAR